MAVGYVSGEATLLRRKLFTDERGVLYIMEWWRDHGLTIKTVRRA